VSNDDGIAKKFGRRIRRLREARGWNQERMAAEVGIHRSYLAGIESGRRNPSLQNIAKIATALGVPIAALFDQPDDD